jgi:holo-[acyl-carrier protein] synthase
MIGIGIDVVDLERFRAVVGRRPELLDRLFTSAEQVDLANRADPLPGLAARFAVKEAAMKALGVGLGSVAFHELEVVGGHGQPPGLQVTGRAADRAALLGVADWHVSLTHGDSVAAAVVVAQ